MEEQVRHGGSGRGQLLASAGAVAVALLGPWIPASADVVARGAPEAILRVLKNTTNQKDLASGGQPFVPLPRTSHEKVTTR